MESSAATVNTMSYRPPSLILSPSKNDPSPESTPAARESQWRVNGIGQLEFTQHDPPSSKQSAESAPKPSSELPLEENSPQDSSSNSSVSQADHAARMSNAQSLHSRGSSTTSNTSLSQNLDMPSIPHTGLTSPLSPDVMVGNISSRRPVSFSGGIPQSDLGRLQSLYTKGQPPSPISTLSRLDGPRTSPPRENLVDVWGEGKNVSATSTPPRYPSLGDQPTDLHYPSGGDMMSPIGGTNSPIMGRHDMAVLSDGLDLTQRTMHGMQASFVGASRATDGQQRLPGRSPLPASYTQQSPQTILPPSGYMYQSQPRPPPLDRSQAAFTNQEPYYDMINSPPAMRRDATGLVQQRGTPLPASPVPMFSPALHTPGSDPSMRTPGAVPIMNGGMGPYVNMNIGMPASGLFNAPPNNTSPVHASFPPGFTNASPQYYPQGAGFNANDALATAMGRMTISPSFPTATQANYDESDTSSVTQSGPSANNRKLGLYKTELCRSWEEKGTCRYGSKCQFAHSDTELRKVSRHPKYKTEICRTFWVSGSCPYGKRCCFIHTELPASGTPPGADGSSPPKMSSVLTDRIPSTGSNRDRSTSNSSGGEPQPISLLQRISAQRETSAMMSPAEQMSPAGGYQFSKPSSGSLRLDTTSLPGKTNYPLTSNPALASTDHHATGMSPILPATAGPDFGRQTAARNEVVGYNGTVGNAQRGLTGTGGKTGGRDSSLRHSFNGTEMGLSINSPVSSSPNMALTPVSPDSASAQTPTGTTSGHQRAGSAGQWPTGSLNSRNNSSTHLASPSTLLPNPSSSTERASPWGPPEISTDRKRFSGTWL